jgi:hypothetical protein
MVRNSNPLTTVVIPWRHDDDREPVLRKLRSEWSKLGFNTILAPCPSVMWNKPLAINSAILRVGTPIVIVADADCWIHEIQDAADLLVSKSLPFVIPHSRVHRLNKKTTRMYVNGEISLKSTLKLAVSNYNLEEKSYPGKPGGGIIIAQKKLLQLVPFDIEFKGWGREDESWYLAAATYTGCRIGLNNRLVHFYHPPQHRITRKQGSEATERRYNLYKGAYGKPVAMQQLIDSSKLAMQSWS